VSAPAGSGSLPKELVERPLAIYIWGRPRRAVNLVLYAFASEINSEYSWLDVPGPGPGGPAEASDPARFGWVPSARTYQVTATEATSADGALSVGGRWTIRHSNAPELRVAELGEFLRLPSVTEEIASHRGSAGRPAVLAAANTDRIADLYAQSPDGLRPLLRSLAERSITLLVGHSGAPGPNAAAYSVIFQVEADNPWDWREARVTCMDGIRLGLLRAGNPVPFIRLAGVSRASERLAEAIKLDRAT
jgi:hypothetical protein